MKLRLLLKDYKLVDWNYFKLIKKTAKYIFFIPRKESGLTHICLGRKPL